MSIDFRELALGIVISAVVVALLLMLLGTFEESMPVDSPARRIVEGGENALVIASTADNSDVVELFFGILVMLGVAFVVWQS